MVYLPTKLGNFWGKCRCAYTSTMEHLGNIHIHTYPYWSHYASCVTGGSCATCQALPFASPSRFERETTRRLFADVWLPCFLCAKTSARGATFMESIGSSTATGAILNISHLQLSSNQVTYSWFYDIPRFVAGKYHGNTVILGSITSLDGFLKLQIDG